MESKSLLNKIAIVTGASRGIGAGIAIELAHRGAHILITYNVAREKAVEIVDQIKLLGRRAILVQADGSDRQSPRRIVDAAVAEYGRIDIIVNNAGIGDVSLIKDMTPEFWDTMLDVNLRLPAFLVQAALPHLGPVPRIVNISSIVARVGYRATSVYAASKAGIEGMTRAWAVELGQQYNATVNCVNPGPVDTDMTRSVDENIDPEEAEYWDRRIRETPAAPRIGTTDDIAQIVAFLCEESSRWCTGSVVNANGGLVTS
jgi:3-oxoacyl-[acyl-carrier protein] reductase